ncbi:MAG: holA [Acidimicrobiales bacterium]|jgi:DNA polymerase-3 subunit delta|nr:holA [Acidimicrobiales bacterium]
MTPAKAAGGNDAVLPAYFVRGDDPVLVSDALSSLVHRLLGDDEAGLAVEELSGDEYELGAVVDAAQTPPFLSERRVVVARDIGRFRTEEVEPLVVYLADPLPTTALVLVGGGGQVSQRLVNAVKKVGHVVEAGTPRQGGDRKAWLATKVKDAAVHLDGAAADLVAAHLGEDVSRLPGLLRILESAYGPGATVGPDEVEPFLGDAGGVAPWDLTDAIDSGDTEAALGHLRRMLGGRHPLVVMATLTNHYARILRLDGADVDEAGAAAALGITGSTFPARKALSQARKLGHDNVARAMTLLADADLALKGTIDWPDELVLEVLVARLSRLTPRARSRAAARR